MASSFCLTNCIIFFGFNLFLMYLVLVSALTYFKGSIPWRTSTDWLAPSYQPWTHFPPHFGKLASARGYVCARARALNKTLIFLCSLGWIVHCFPGPLHWECPHNRSQSACPQRLHPHHRPCKYSCFIGPSEEERDENLPPPQWLMPLFIDHSKRWFCVVRFWPSRSQICPPSRPRCRLFSTLPPTSRSLDSMLW